jgi:hypothetical protein
MSFNLFYSGKIGHLKMLHSVNMFQRPDRKLMNYIAIGHELEYEKWDIYLDLIHHANGLNDWGNNFAVVSCANLYFNKEFNIFVKGAYEQNRSEKALPGFGDITTGFYDIFCESAHSYLTYGLGMEYHPKTCPDFRFHAFVANCRTTDYSLPTPAVFNSLRANIGITWSMEIYRMLKNRMARILQENQQ